MKNHVVALQEYAAALKEHFVRLMMSLMVLTSSCGVCGGALDLLVLNSPNSNINPYYNITK